MKDSTNTSETGLTRRELGRAVGRTGLAFAAAAILARAGQAAEAPKTPMPMPMKHSMAGYGIPDGPPQQVALLIYPMMTALDLVGPQQILASMGNVDVHLVWKDKNTLYTDSGIPMQATKTLAECPDNLTVLFVPGGSRGTVPLMNDPEVIGFLTEKAKTARYVTSVCTGALLLGAAGLLNGYRANTHWAYRDLLPLMGAAPVNERVVIDRNRITGGGVTAGLDFGLRLVSLLRNDKHAKSTQLAFEYDPQPPFHAGTPAGAGEDITHMIQTILAPIHAEAEAAARKAHDRFTA